MLEIQKFIRKFSSIEEANFFLRNRLHLSVWPQELKLLSGKLLPVWVYNYHPDRSPAGSTIVREASGLILDKNADVVSMSFPRLFNAGSPFAPKIDWNTAYAEFKHDGKLVVLYNHLGRWFIQTKMSASGEEPMPGGGLTYRQAVTAILQDKFGENWRAAFDGSENLCLAFELVSPYNNKITKYSSSDIVLIGMFDKARQRELPRQRIVEMCKVMRFTLTSSTDVYSEKNTIIKMDRLKKDDEGFVVRDHQSNRIIFRSSKHDLLEKLVFNTGERIPAKFLAEIVLSGQTNLAIELRPALRQTLSIVFGTMLEISQELNSVWLSYMLSDKAELDVCGHPFGDIVGDLDAGKIISIEKGLEAIDPVQLIKEVRKRKGVEFLRELSSLRLTTRG